MLPPLLTSVEMIEEKKRVRGPCSRIGNDELAPEPSFWDTPQTHNTARLAYRRAREAETAEREATNNLSGDISSTPEDDRKTKKQRMEAGVGKPSKYIPSCFASASSSTGRHKKRGGSSRKVVEEGEMQEEGLTADDDEETEDDSPKRKKRKQRERIVDEKGISTLAQKSLVMRELWTKLLRDAPAGVHHFDLENETLVHRALQRYKAMNRIPDCKDSLHLPTTADHREVKKKRGRPRAKCSFRLASNPATSTPSFKSLSSLPAPSDSASGPCPPTKASYSSASLRRPSKHSRTSRTEISTQSPKLNQSPSQESTISLDSASVSPYNYSTKSFSPGTDNSLSTSFEADDISDESSEYTG